MNSIICTVGALCSFLVAPTLKAQCALPTVPLGTVRIRGGTIFAGLVDFGLTNKICFGIEFDDDEFLRSPIDLELADATGLTAIRSAIKAHPRYSVTSDGFLSVRARAKPVATWLDFRIHRFDVQRIDVQNASNVLNMFLAEQIKPGGGYAGNFRVVDNTDLVGPFDEKDRTVRELLNLIVTSSKGAVWVTTGPYDKKTPAAPGKFWTILEYSDRNLRSPVDLRGLEQRIISAFAW